MKPALGFRVLDWADATHVLKVHLFGTNHNGDTVDERVTFHEPVTIPEVHRVIAMMNNGQYRSS